MELILSLGEHFTPSLSKRDCTSTLCRRCSNIFSLLYTFTPSPFLFSALLPLNTHLSLSLSITISLFHTLCLWNLCSTLVRNVFFLFLFLWSVYLITKQLFSFCTSQTFSFLSSVVSSFSLFPWVFFFLVVFSVFGSLVL